VERFDRGHSLRIPWAQVCREYGLADSVLSRWRREYQERGEAAFLPQASDAPTTEAQRIAELERFCGQLADVRTRC